MISWSARWKRRKGLATGLSWDNFDENLETLSGSGTLHDTVGICYQNEVPGQQRNEMQHMAGPWPKRQRSFDAIEGGIEPYKMKPRISEFNYGTTEMIAKPDTYHQAQKMDTAWMIFTAISNDTPMWVGWKSLLIIDILPKQKICYMERCYFNHGQEANDSIGSPAYVKRKCHENY